MKRSLRSWLWHVPLDQEVNEELALHIELRTRELVERGMDPRAARDLVLSRIGDLGQLKRTCVDLGRKRDREMRLTQRLEDLRNDVRFAIRQLRRAPGFTLVAALTLALGIGANSAIFALADATLLRPFPFPEADRLVMVWERLRAGGVRSGDAPLNLATGRNSNRTFPSMAANDFLSARPREWRGRPGTSSRCPGTGGHQPILRRIGVKPIARPHVPPLGQTAAARHRGVERRLLADVARRRSRSARNVRSSLAAQPFTYSASSRRIRTSPRPSRGEFQLGHRRSSGRSSTCPARWRHGGAGSQCMMVVGRLKPERRRRPPRATCRSIAAALAEEFPATEQGARRQH